MMRFSESRGLELVDTKRAVSIGTVDGFVVDPRTHRITALRLTHVDADGEFVDYDELEGFGRDAVTVAGSGRIRPARDQRDEGVASRDLDLVGKRLLTESGNEVGEITDVEFDPSDGTVTELFTPRASIAGDRLIGVGSYAVVVASDTEDAEADPVAGA
jgi:sporulation protein YlmC with PRC-barrel domain